MISTMREEADKFSFQMMVSVLDPRDYPSRQAMRQHARELLKDVKRRRRIVENSKLTKRSSRAERDASKIKES